MKNSVEFPTFLSIIIYTKPVPSFDSNIVPYAAIDGSSLHHNEIDIPIPPDVASVYILSVFGSVILCNNPLNAILPLPVL